MGQKSPGVELPAQLSRNIAYTQCLISNTHSRNKPKSTTKEMVQGTKRKKRKRKKPNHTTKNMENTDEHTHTQQNKNNNKKSRNPIQDRGRKGATVDPKGSVASPEGDREPLEEMTSGFLWGKPQALTHETPNLGNGVSS